MKILSRYMNWQKQNPAVPNNDKFWIASNHASITSTDEEGKELSDKDILDLLFKASNGRSNKKLFDGDTSDYADDHSAADLAFVSRIAFYTQDPDQIDSIFCQSKLMREKWEEKHSATGETYGEMTINKALADLGNTYSPPRSHKPTRGGFQLISGSEIIKLPTKTDWLIEDFIPNDSTVLIFGEPASGKSLIALEMACCIGSGQNWADKPVKQGDVVYIAGEGFNGLSKRLNALVQEKGLSVEHLHCSESAMDLMLDDSVEEVVEIVRNIQNLRLIIIDTLHRNSTGDENNSREFAVILKHCDQLRSATGATIMLVHHCGHGEKNRSRGSSSIKGAMDAEFKVSESNKLVTLTCTKMKDDEKPGEIKFDLKTIAIGEDEDGKAISAPILEKSTTFFTADTSRESETPNPTEQLVLNVLARLSGENNEPVQRSDWKSAALEVIPVKADSKDPQGTKSKRFSRCINALLDLGVVTVENDCFIAADSGATTGGDEEDE